MKIIDVNAFYAPQGGGVRTYVDHKLRIGSALGHDILIVAPGRTDRIETRPEGGRIRYLASPALPVDRRYRYFDDPAAIHAVLDEERPDVVEASTPWRTASIVADWHGNAARALIMHADPLAAYAYRWFGGIADRAAIDRGFQWFWNHLRRAGGRFDLVVSASPDLSRRLREGGLNNICTIPLGVDPGIFSPLRGDERVRQELLERCALGPDASLMLAVGRHSAEKRWPMVIDACLRAGLHRKLGLVLIGDGRDRPRIVRHIGGNPHIHLLAPIGDRARLATVLASGDALIHGCEAETFGLVAAEAAASGLPIVVPAEGGAAAHALPECSETFAHSSAIRASDAILRLLDENFPSKQSIAESRALHARTIDTHFADLFAGYSAISAERRRAA
jgi:alpha-1,6-mannosyltransferase